MVIQEGLVGLILGGVSSLLLSVIAYFLKLLVQDIRDLKKEQMNLKELCIWLKAEQGVLKREVKNLIDFSK
ncbi:MAG: hypothetical protein EA341_07280 [Mongoliibacter sp.]|uniref:hypothetical protein n=1 Tax=Mongoliibacter sp. TaxID=2022438 RepID=UPI0012F1D6A5|nr:hypothetical protein [Mongoliibacter sp.]TVP50558.1 MAG: hypothetical protein EA341_07280 [Mongoliibacter sp.]